MIICLLNVRDTHISGFISLSNPPESLALYQINRYNSHCDVIKQFLIFFMTNYTSKYRGIFKLSFVIINKFKVTVADMCVFGRGQREREISRFLRVRVSHYYCNYTVINTIERERIICCHKLAAF